MSTTIHRSFWQRVAPALTLMVFAVLITETLSGATRPSVYLGFPAIFIFELTVWGGFAVFVRFLVRRQGLNWPSLFLLGLAVGIAEEFLIQQTSIAPLVIKLHGVEYARVFGINYIYLLWALAYESVFVVVIPVTLAELLFGSRRSENWLSKSGLIVLYILFCIGAIGAWFSWTQYARIKVFHMPPYHPPANLLLLGILLIGALSAVAIGPLKKILSGSVPALSPPPAWILSILSAWFTVYLWGLAAIAFGAKPDFPPAIALVLSLLVFAVALFLMTRWISHASWSDQHRYYLIAGAIIANMGGGYLGYIGATAIDFWGKTILNVIALILLITLAISRKYYRDQPDAETKPMAV